MSSTTHPRPAEDRHNGRRSAIARIDKRPDVVVRRGRKNPTRSVYAFFKIASTARATVAYSGHGTHTAQSRTQVRPRPSRTDVPETTRAWHHVALSGLERPTPRMRAMAGSRPAVKMKREARRHLGMCSETISIRQEDDIQHRVPRRSRSSLTRLPAARGDKHALANRFPRRSDARARESIESFTPLRAMGAQHDPRSVAGMKTGEEYPDDITKRMWGHAGAGITAEHAPRAYNDFFRSASPIGNHVNAY